MLRKHRVAVLSAACILISAVVVGVSYVILRRFIFSGSYTETDYKQRLLAQELRKELLERSGVQQVLFASSDGFSLHGLFFPARQPKGNLVICHGYKSCKEFMYRLLDIFPSYNILLFDFRAHGQSEGSVTSIGCHEYKDVNAAVAFVKQHTASVHGSFPLFILGISMGGAAALRACALSPDLCDALVIDSTYAHLAKMFLRGFTLRVGLPYYPFFPVIRSLFHYYADCSLDSVNNVKHAECVAMPVLFIHSCNDEFIPPKDTVRMYAAASKNKRAKIWITPPCEHGYLHSRQAEHYAGKIQTFFDEVSGLKGKH